MFSVTLKNNYANNKKTAGQFARFREEGGKLPSFSVCIDSLQKVKLPPFSVIKELGDYTYYQDDDRHFWISFCNAYMQLDDDYRGATVYLPDKPNSDGSYEASYLLMQAYMCRLVTTGNFMIHSAAIVYKNNGILFCGLSGAGKSTQANLWKKHLQCSVLNYDKPCVIQENGRYYAHGSPWSGKEKLFKNEYVPLKAIVYVVQAKENRVRKLSPAEAMSHIFLHNYVYPFTEEIESQYLSAINAAAEHVAVYELSCNISEDAVETLYNALFENTYKEAKEELKMEYKTKNNFMMKEIADECIVIPRGSEALNFNGSVVLNEAGAFLWNQMDDYIDEEELAQRLQRKYRIDTDLAKKDTKAFLDKMNANGLVDIKEG